MLLVHQLADERAVEAARLLHEAREFKVRRLRCADGAPVELSGGKAGAAESRLLYLFLITLMNHYVPNAAGEGAAEPDYHLFLSHVWGTGQDQMRIVKQRLLEMLPDARAFLDVDDLEEIGGLEGKHRRLP